MGDEAPPATGWEPGAPVGDTYLRRFLLNWAEAAASPVAAMGGRVVRHDGLIASDRGRPAGFFNCATLLQPLAPERVEAVLTELDAFFGLSGGEASGEVILFSAWPTPDLRPHGWALMGHPPLHLRPSGGEAPAPPPGLAIEEVRDATTLRDFEAVAVEGYPLDELRPLTPGALLDERVLADGRLRLWLGRVGGEPASIAAAFVEHGVVDVAFVATMPGARRKGYGEALTWRATLAEPGLPAMLLSSDDGRPVYERMGFLPLLRFTLWYRTRG